MDVGVQIQVLVFEKPQDLAATSRFDVAASDVVVVTTNVLTKEFSRCFASPLETAEQQQQRQRQQQRGGAGAAAVSGAEAERQFWQQFIARTDQDKKDCRTSEATLLQKLVSVIPAEQKVQLLSELRKRARRSSSVRSFVSTSADAAACGANRLLFATSPLLGVHFARVAVDEGHRLVHSNSLHVQLACSLRADKRWACGRLYMFFAVGVAVAALFVATGDCLIRECALPSWKDTENGDVGATIYACEWLGCFSLFEHSLAPYLPGRCFLVNFNLPSVPWGVFGLVRLMLTCSFVSSFMVCLCYSYG